jgi:diadenosine tetraphosphate (Ap4A) HIT family hydrolase
MNNKNFNANEFYNQRLYETENFAVIPALGSIVEGWLLIIPKERYISFGYFQLPQLFDELSQLINDVSNIVQKLYGAHIIFENGAFCSNTLVGCGVDYAHFHIVPTKHNLIETIENEFGIYYDWKQIDSLSESVKYIEDKKPYLYYNTQQRESLITTNDNIPSQLFRKALAFNMGLPDEYDWKKYPFTENIHKTIDIYKGKF